MSQQVKTTSEVLRELSEWIDNSPENAVRDPEARTWGRLSKVAEEAGEVITAYIGVTNQNPRKGVYATEDDVKKELLDTAVTALCAYEHMTGNRGNALLDLFTHVKFLSKRAGIREMNYDPNVNYAEKLEELGVGRRTSTGFILGQSNDDDEPYV